MSEDSPPAEEQKHYSREEQVAWDEACIRDLIEEKKGEFISSKEFVKAVGKSYPTVMKRLHHLINTGRVVKGPKGRVVGNKTLYSYEWYDVPVPPSERHTTKNRHVIPESDHKPSHIPIFTESTIQQLDIWLMQFGEDPAHYEFLQGAHALRNFVKIKMEQTSN